MVTIAVLSAADLVFALRNEPQQMPPEVLDRAMTRKPEPIEWDPTMTTAATVPKEAPVEDEVSTLTAH